MDTGFIALVVIVFIAGAAAIIAFLKR